MGQDEIAANGRPDALRVLVVLTDGASNVEADGSVCFDDINPTMPTACTEDAIEQAAVAKAAGSVVFTIGLNLDALDETFPGQGQVARDTMLAMATDQGKFFEAVDGSVLAGIFEEVGQQIIGVAGTDVTIVEVLPDNLTYIDGSAIPEPTTVNGQTLTWNVGIVSVGATSCVTLAATVENPTANMLVDVFPDSRVDFTDFNEEPGSIPFPETRETVESCIATIGDYVWYDINEDGQQGDPADEPGVPGVTVNILDESGMQINTTTTDDNGFYEFMVPPGNYIIEFVLPDGTTFTTPGEGDPATDSNADESTGRSETVTLGNQEVNDTIDAGIVPQPSGISITLSSADCVCAGETVELTVTVENTGDEDLVNVQVTGTTFPACSMTIGNLAAGESAAYTCSVTATADTTHMASVAGEDTFGRPVSATGAGTIDVDTAAPVVTSCAPDVTIECGEQIPAPDVDSVVAEDDCSEVTVTAGDDVDSGTTCPQVITRTYIVADACGNTTTCEQTITVEDTTPPTIDCPLVGPRQVGFAVTDEGLCIFTVPDVTGDSTVSDDCSDAAAVQVTQSPAEGSLATGSVSIVLTALDECGNAAECETMVSCEELTCTPNGRVFHDANDNGEVDAEDIPYANRTVTLFRVVGQTTEEVETAVTGPDGAFTFGATSAGQYRVQVLPPIVEPGVVDSPTLPNPSATFDYDPFDTSCFEVLIATVPDDCDFCGVVWYDGNNNGLLRTDAEEDLTKVGINGVTVYLRDEATMEIVQTSVTQADSCSDDVQNGEVVDGVYRFTEIPQGNYIVEVDTNTVPAMLFELFDRELNPDETARGIDDTTPLAYSLVCEGVEPSAPGDRPDGENRDFGFVQEVTPIELGDFDAVHMPGGVLVTWETLLELENLGFNVYRSDSEDGERTQVNAQLIPGQGTGHGDVYELFDATAGAGVTYYYWLEDIDWGFKATVHGPAVAAGEDDGEAPLAAFAADEAGIYRITAEDLLTVGLESLGADVMKIQINGTEVPAYVTTAQGPLGEDDFIMVVAEADDVIEIVVGEDPARMEELDATPAAGQVWYGSATEGGTAEILTSSEYGRYVAIGFTEEPILVLDVTDASAPNVLYGYAVLDVNGELAAYFGSPNGAGARIVVVDDRGLRDAEPILGLNRETQ